MSSIDTTKNETFESNAQISHSNNISQKILPSHVWRDMFLWEYKSILSVTNEKEENKNPTASQS